MTQLPGQSLMNLWPGDSVLCVKDMRAQLLLSYDSGETWNPTGLIIDHLHIGLDGSIVTVTPEREIFHSSDNGRTFQRVAEGLIPQTTFIQLIGEGNHVYIVNYGDPQTRFFQSTDGGGTWGEIETLAEPIWRFAVGPDGSLYALQHGQMTVKRYGVDDNAWTVAVNAPSKLIHIGFGRDGRLYAVSVTDSLYRSEPGETELIPFATDFRFGADITVNSRGEVYEEVPDGPVTLFMRYSSDGNRGEEIPTNLYYQLDEFNLRLGPNDDLWLIGGSYGAYRFDSSTSGHEFHPIVFHGYGAVQSHSYTPGGDQFILANRRAYRTTDEGINFVEMNLPDKVISTSDGIGYVDTATLSLISQSSGYHSTDHGMTWERGEITRARFHRLENGTLFSLNGIYVQKSTDKGVTWNRVNGLRPAIVYMDSRDGHVYGISNHPIQYSSD